MSGDLDSRNGPFTLNEVLTEELKALRSNRFESLRGTGFIDPARPQENEEGRSANLRAIYQEIASLQGDDRLSAICLSGGGIRSATFNLGVIQALARAGVLAKFDYLSTVSGGGYIGGWLSAWLHREGRQTVIDELTKPPAMPLKPEPRPLDRLREYSNFLTPRSGLMSGDTWAAFAIILRNILLNWLVVVPVLIAIVAVPLVFDRVVSGSMSWSPQTVIALALLLAVGALAAVQRERLDSDDAAAATARVLGFGLVPMVIAAALLTTAVRFLPPAMQTTTTLLAISALWCLAVPVAAFAAASLIGVIIPERKRARPHGPPWDAELFALVVTGAVATALLFWIAGAVYPWLQPRPTLYALLATPLLLSLHLLARTLHVALADWASGRWSARHPAHSLGAAEDAAREWWARYSGYVMLGTLAWIGIAWLALYGWSVAHAWFDEYAPHALAGAGGIAGGAAALLGGRGGSSSGRGGDGGADSALQTWAMRLAGPILCLAVVPLCAQLYRLLAAAFAGVAGGVITNGLLLFATPILLLLLLAALAGMIVNVNRFSLHGFYRNRLVRAYLGASNTRRAPDPFTGFDPADNLKMSRLRMDGAGDPQRPLHVINTTLNLVSGERLAWQQRKAESFSMSPLFCGNFYEGYRHTHQYGGRGGVTLGTAIAISGAAANPNMGYYSSPAVTFLLALVNGRLGAWLGNTNHHGERTYRHSAPKWALRLMLDELLGRTRSNTPYVQLSDGGHFENLGVYEMIMRRCRFILSSDVGRDPTSGFQDLGNMIRKVRIDFGIDIVFDEPIRILPRSADGPGLACAVGRIRYEMADGAGVEDGTLVYIKPTLSSDGVVPYDVFSYSRKSQDFPHESTVDQWFDESQFESYRILGSHLMERLTGSMQAATISELEASARAYVAGVPTAPTAAIPS